MARGWESKSVEDQVADATEDKAKRAELPTSDDQRAYQQQIKSLELSLTFIKNQISESRSDRHRAQLEQARLDLEHQIERLAKPTLPGQN